jgi:class 3 adenylate cyclase/TolB-like protein
MTGMSNEQREIVAVMFTDLRGYSAMVQRDERLALALLERQRRMAEPVIAAHHGRLVKTIGDALMVEFRSALEAVACATALQRRLHEHNEKAPDAEHILVRIGVHLGDVVRRGGDLFGDTVNIAARIEPEAPPGGIALSNAVYEQIHNKFEYPVVALGSFNLKGIAGKTPLYSVILPWLGAGRRQALAKGLGAARGRTALLALAAAGVLLLGVGVVYLRHESAGRPDLAAESAPAKSIAVLPFENLSADAGNGYFAGGIQDEILTLLAQMGDLKVISRTSTERYGSRPGDLKAVAHELGVATVLEGSVQKSGDKVLINVQLIDAQTDNHVWAQSYQRTVDDVFAVESEVAQQIADALKVKLATPEAERLARLPTGNPAAHDLYLRARALFDRSDEDSALQEIALTDQALAIDANYAAAWALRADAYLTLATAYRAPLEVLSLERESARKAVAADPGLADGHIELGAFEMAFDWDPAAAKREFDEAVRLDPNSAYVQFWLGEYYSNIAHDFAQSRAAFEKGRQLDPLSAWYPAYESKAAMSAGEQADAIRLARQAMDIDPGFFFGTDPVANIYAAQGRWQDCIARYQALPAAAHVSANYQLGACYIHAGDAAKGKAILAGLESHTGYVDKTKIAVLYTALGDKDRAFAALEQALRDRSPVMNSLEYNHMLQPLKDDPRFKALVARVSTSVTPLPSGG